MSQGIRNWLLVGAVVTLGISGLGYGSTASRPNVPRATPITIVPSRTDQRFGFLAEPLVAFAAPSVSETHDLERSLTRFRASKTPVRTATIDAFLKKYPHSAWRVSLLTNEGLAELHAGYISQAIHRFTLAWHAGAGAKNEPERAIRDRALGQLLTLETRLGHTKKVKALIAAIGKRKLAGSASELLASAKDGLWDLEHNPGTANRCGAAALEAVAKVEKASKATRRVIEQAKSHRYGMTLAQLTHLAAKAHLPSRAVYRSGNEAIPVPSVVHWKEKHYGAIVGEKNGLYHLKDPVFNQDQWLTRAAIENQSSGYFLVPDKVANESWRTVAEARAARVIGAGNTHKSKSGDTSADDVTKNRHGCHCTGMANYDVFLMLVSLEINDKPVGYTPPVGPAVPIKLSYIQREAYEPANFSYSNLGHKWTFNWQSFVKDDPNNLGRSVSIGLLGGGTRFYGGYNSSNGVFRTEERTGAELVMTSSSPVTYERRMHDGTVYVYGASDGSTSYPRRVFLTKEIDPRGNAVTLSYDSQMRLMTITDAIGQQTTFSYTDANDPLKITAITDPFGRQATIDYDSSGRLTGITDEIGLHSQFSYDSGTFINGMTTPYGTTKFAYGTGPNLQRWLNITDPKGQTERVEFRHGAPGIGFYAFQPSGINTFNAYINYRNTFYWDKSAWADAPGNYQKAKIFHWLHTKEDTGQTAGVLESTLDHRGYRIWYNYPGQTWAGATGTLDEPSAVARVLDDGSTRVNRFSYNRQGNVTRRIDPVGRELDYTYAANGVDLIKVTRRTATGHDILAQYTYNDQHEPLTYTDAAGQTTTYTYNATGQRTSKTDPIGNTTAYTYDSNGYLTTVTNADGKVARSYTYDAFGRVASTTDSEGYTLQYAYDNLNRLTAITYPDGTERTITWDKLDPVSYTDREGRTTTYAYDSIREQVSKTSPMGHVTSYGYEPNGELASITDPNGHTTSWTYDFQGRVTGEQYDDGSKETYAYWPRSGDLESVTDALGQTKSYTYTHDDRLAGIQYLNAVNPTASVSFSYDPYYPRLTGMTDGIGTTSYEYYPAGVLGAERLESKQGPRPHDTISYAYDADMRLTGRTVDGATETFSYDAINRETGDTNPLGAFTMRYLGETDQPTERDIAGVPYRVRYGYESNLNDRRLKDIYNETTLNGATQPIADFVFTTSPEDLILSRAENDGTTAGHRHQGWNIGHHYGWSHAPHWGVLAWLLGSEPGKDDDHHPARHDDDSGHEHSGHGDDHDGLDPDSRQHHGAQDDDDGGHGGIAAVATTYTYDNDLRLTGASGGLTESYVYDPASNLNSLTESGSTTSISVNDVNEIQAAGSNNYVYDADGNVLDDGTHTFVWDAANRLIGITDKATGHVSTFRYDGRSHRVTDTETDPGAAPVETHYLWCGDALCEKRDATDSVLARYYQEGELQGIQAYYYAEDEVGSIVALVDASGVVAGRVNYSSYGQISSSSGTLPDFRYAGLQAHSGSGFLLGVFRVYDSSIARWVNRDPLGDQGGINAYRYAGANPVSYEDPQGFSSRRAGRSGGPYHSPIQRKRCFPSDSCGTLRGKMSELQRMIKSHEGWDRNVPRPNGGNRHAKEIADLWRAYARCQSYYSAKKCDCPPKGSSSGTQSGSVPQGDLPPGTLPAVPLPPDYFPPVYGEPGVPVWEGFPAFEFGVL